MFSLRMSVRRTRIVRRVRPVKRVQAPAGVGGTPNGANGSAPTIDAQPRASGHIAHNGALRLRIAEKSAAVDTHKPKPWLPGTSIVVDP